MNRRVLCVLLSVACCGLRSVSTLKVNGVSRTVPYILKRADQDHRGNNPPQPANGASSADIGQTETNGRFEGAASRGNAATAVGSANAGADDPEERIVDIEEILTTNRAFRTDEFAAATVSPKAPYPGTSAPETPRLSALPTLPRSPSEPSDNELDLSRSFRVELQSSLSETPTRAALVSRTEASPTESLEIGEVSTVVYTVPYGGGSSAGYNFVSSPTINEASMTAAFREDSEESTEVLSPRPERRQDVAPNIIRPSDTAKSKNPSRNPTIEILTGLIQLLGGDVRRRATPPPLPPPLPPSQIMHPNFNFHPPQNPMMGPPPPPQFLPPLPHAHHRPPLFDLAQQAPNRSNIPAYFPVLNLPVAPHHVPHQTQSFFYPSPSDVSNVLGVDGPSEVHPHRFELKTPDAAPTVTVPVEVDDAAPATRSSYRNTIVFIHDAPPSLLLSTTALSNPQLATLLPHPAQSPSARDTPVALEPAATQRPSVQTAQPSDAWLAVGAYDTSRINIKYDPHNEPDIITQAAEPSIFDVTVVGDLNPTISHTKDLGPPPEIITETFDDVRPSRSFSISATPTQIAPSSTTTTIIYSEPDSSRRTAGPSPTPTLGPSLTDEVVYGRGSSTEASAANPVPADKVSTSSTWSSTALPPKSHGIGKPYVVSVDVDPVRPSVQQGGFGHIKQASRPATTPPNIKQKPKRPTFKTKTNATLVRIDTCIVGDDSTCDANVNEWCKTDQGISTCTCRPGYARIQPRGPCLATISMQLTFKLDRMGDKKLHFNTNYLNPDSEDYQMLAFETCQALRSLFTKSTFSRVFMDSKVNRFKGSGSKVLVNATVEFEENDITRVASVKRVVQHEMVNLISRGQSRLGDSRLFVEPLLNSALTVEDVNECRDPELHDCSVFSNCENNFGNFKCVCKSGYTDKNPDTRRAGRICAGCGPDFCNNRGECSIVDGEKTCLCKGKFIGPQCDIDGEVLAVALGASVTAVVIIILTLVCLCLWNRRWKREQANAEVMSVASVAGYLNKTNSIGYRMHQSAAQDDRFRWSSYLDSLPNIYVQPDSSPLHSMPRAQSIYATQRHMRSHSPAMELENPYGHLQGRPKSRGGLTHFGPASLASPYEFDPNKQASSFGSYRNPGTTRSMKPVFNVHW